MRVRTFTDMEKPFCDALNEWYDRIFPGRWWGSQKQFAEICRRRTSTVHRWLAGERPYGDAGPIALRRIAAWWEENKPEYASPEESGAGEIAESGVLGVTGIRIAGSVSAGKFRLPEEGLGRMEFSGIWRGSAYARLVDAKEEVSLIQVKGDSMEPFCPDGAWLACGKLAGKATDLPDRAPVIATAEGLTTFKLWHVDGETAELLPLNILAHNIQRVPVAEVVIDWVVLGVARPWVLGFGK